MGKFSSGSDAGEEVHGAADYDGFVDIHARVLQALKRNYGLGIIEHFLCLEGAHHFIVLSSDDGVLVPQVNLAALVVVVFVSLIRGKAEGGVIVCLVSSLTLLFLGVAQAGIFEAHRRLFQLVQVEVLVCLQVCLMRAYGHLADRRS